MRHRLGCPASWTAATLIAVALAMAGSTARASGIDQLVAGDGQLIAIRDGEVLTFAPDGTRTGRCGRPAAPPAQARRLRVGDPDAGEILHEAGLPEDDSTLQAEEALEDERGLDAKPRAHSAAAAGAPAPRALAASATGVWVATSDGVLLVQGQGCLRVALPGRDLIAIAAGPGAIVAASASQLFRADSPDPARAGGWSFRSLAGLSAPPRALAIAADGDTLVADAAGVLRVGASGENQRALAGRVDALAACDGAVMALASDAVFIWRDHRFVRAGRRPPVRTLGCARGSARRWLAGGTGVWASGDGALWTEQPAPPGALVTAVAGLPGRIWMLADGGLTPCLADETAVAAAATACCDEPPRPVPNRVPAWIWPTVTATVTIDRTLTRRTVTGFVVLRFPFDRPPRGAAEQSALALEWTRRDAARLRAQLAATAAGEEPR